MTAHLALRACDTLKLRPTAPFNFDATPHKPDHFPSADTAWEPGVRWQTMRWRGKTCSGAAGTNPSSGWRS